MFKFFEDMEAQNENFFYDVQVDEEDRIKNIFWANASCRAAYADFGDCVTFDTTYKTNKLHMPLAVFVGANNHLQSCIFALALIGEEDEDSFKWVFSTFLRCMRGKQPMVILTGQCSYHVLNKKMHALSSSSNTKKQNNLQISAQQWPKRYPRFSCDLYISGAGGT